MHLHIAIKVVKTFVSLRATRARIALRHSAYLAFALELQLLLNYMDLLREHYTLLSNKVITT